VQGLQHQSKNTVSKLIPISVMAISDLSLLLFVQNISYEHDNDVKVQMKQSFTKKWLHIKTDFTTEAKDHSKQPINLGSSRFYLGQQQCSR